MELVVYNIKGEKTDKTVTLNESVFEATPNDHAIYLDTKQYLANQRQGTHASLEKSMVSGSTKKLKKQKAQVVHVQVAVNHHCSEAEPAHSVHNHATIASN